MLENTATIQAVNETVVDNTATVEKEATNQPKKKIKPKKPGRITSKAVIVLQTKPAQRLFSNSLGVTEFSKKMSVIWHAAAADDPYADLFLLRIYDALIQARRRLEKLKNDSEQLLLQTADGIKLELGQSSRPTEFPLQFGTPFGYMAAYMLADYDKLARTFLTLRQLGLIDGYVNELLNEATDMIKEVLSKPNGWQYTGITRQDIVAKNQIAKKAEKLMGKIDKQIIAGKLRAPNAPPIKGQSGKVEVKRS